MVGEFNVLRGFRIRVSTRVAATALLGRRKALPLVLGSALVGLAGSGLLALQRYPAWPLPALGFACVFLGFGIVMTAAYLGALRRYDRYPVGGVVRVAVAEDKLEVFETNRRTISIPLDRTVAISQTFGYAQIFVNGEQFTDLPSEALPAEIRAPHSIQFVPKRLPNSSNGS